MIKVRILDRCEFYDDEEYVFDHQDVDSNGETYDRYRPCEVCQGSGNQAKWVGLREFSDLLERAISFEPDYDALAKEQPISQYQDSVHIAPINPRLYSVIR